jgi:hypothetical protein
LKIPSTLGEWKDIFELLSYVTVVLGLPAAIYQYRRSKLREQADREYGTYNALDEKYLDFQARCFEHPELDIFDIPDENPRPLNDEQRKQELIAFTTLISVFERAYLMYHDQSSSVKAAQWTGWDEYVCSYCERDNFRNAWEVSGETFDRNFENYVEEIMQRSQRKAAAPRLTEAQLQNPALRRITATSDEDYLSALRLASQYGWAGGVFNTNELSYLIASSSPSRLSSCFVILSQARAVGFAAVSYLPSAQLIVIHEMTVAQSITRDALFSYFWSQLEPALAKEHPAATAILAELPRNDPRHLKTEVFARGLSSVGFTAAAWDYFLPTGFNHRQTPIPAQLYVKSKEALTTMLFMGMVQALYLTLYLPLWRSFGDKSGEFDREIRELQSRVSDAIHR